MARKHLAFIVLLTVSVIWGFTLPLMKVNLDTIPPLVLAFSRFFIASICALFLVKLNGLTLKAFLHIGVFAFFGITLSIGLLLFGLQGTSSINTVFILALSPIITSLLAVFAIKERLSRFHALGIFLAFSGTFIYLLYPNLFQPSQISFNLVNDFLILLSVLCGAVFIIGSKSLFDSYHPSTIGSVCFFVATLSFFPGAVNETIQDPSWLNNFDAFNVFSIMFLGVFSSFLAYLGLEWGLSKLPVYVNQVVSYLTPIVTVIVSTAFLNEELLPIFPLSAILVAAGIFLTYRYKPSSTHHYHHRTHRV